MTMAADGGPGVGGIGSTAGGGGRYIVQVFVGALSHQYEALSVEASKQTTADEIVACIAERLSLAIGGGAGASGLELAEVVGDWGELAASNSSSSVTSSGAAGLGMGGGTECKERRLGPNERPVAVMLLWPRAEHQHCYRFYLREKQQGGGGAGGGFAMDPQLVRDYFYRFLYQPPEEREYPDLCQLPDLNEQTLLDNLRARFHANHIYTYVGSILIALNPFKFHPIYNPKYVKLYQNRRLGLAELPPHIFAIADAAYHCMLRERRNQCVVISGESGSGKTESTNFLLHHLTALSQKGSHASGVEQTILSAGPVLEAFGNAKTAHNNNSSRFGKFIQVNYKENGMVHGAVVQKYLLEKSRICSQGRNERNYHVFYYLLAGASEADKQLLHLRPLPAYNYLNRNRFESDAESVESVVDENYEFSRLKQSMEMVGFTPEKQRRLFAVLSAVLLLGNIEFQPRKGAYHAHHDEAVCVRNPELVALVSQLLRVKQETLLAALTAKRARASGETLVISYRLPEAVAARDAMAKCLYGALFDWIVMQVNHALLSSKKDSLLLREHQGNSIGVLDIFGFEDFGVNNSFEQLCINYANEHLQHYFNQHVFKYEQELYYREGIRWSDIHFLDNTACLQLIEAKPNGLLCLLDDQCNFPGASNETLLQKFNSVHKDNNFYEMPQKKEPAFIVRHYAGKVKYQVAEMREKNLDLMRTEMVGVLKNSSMAFVRELVGADPVAVFRWAILRAFFRAHFAFHDAGRRLRQCRVDGTKPSLIHNRIQNHIPNENVIRFGKGIISSALGHHAPLASTKATSNLARQQQLQQRPPIINNNNVNDVRKQPLRTNNRLSWPQSALMATSQQTLVTSSKAVTSSPPTSPTSPAHQQSGDAPRRALFFPAEAQVIERATQIVMKNKSFRPRERGSGGKKGLKNLQSVKTLAGRTHAHTLMLSQHQQQQQQQQVGGGKARKQPLTVTAQFQHSLHSLMDTLNQANPFFIRCIKSNAHKIANKFDDDTVQRQLRYTGMLETVRIRQAGYNVRLSYDEFIQLYRILLPRGLLSSQSDVREFLLTLNLNRDNYQAGGSKVFLRECEKLKLDYRLHQQIVASIVAIQRWFRALLERRRFLRLKNAVLTLQSYWRMVLAQRCLAQLRQLHSAAIQLQCAWRGWRTHHWFQQLRAATTSFQAHARGYLARQRYRRQLLQMQCQAQAAMAADDAASAAADNGEQFDHQHFIEMEKYGADHDETMRRLRALAQDAEEMREIKLGDPNKEILGVERRKKQSPRRSMPKTTLPDETLSLMSKVERKGSCDSLASQRSVDSQTSAASASAASASATSAPVRDTLYRAKKQIQALMGMVKKTDQAAAHQQHQHQQQQQQTSAHSDSEMEHTSGDTSAAVAAAGTQRSPHAVTAVWMKRSVAEPPLQLTADRKPQTAVARTVSAEPTAPRRAARRAVGAVQSGGSSGASRGEEVSTRVRSSHTQVPTSLDLKRRNSDPSSAAGATVKRQPPVASQLPAQLPSPPVASQLPSPPSPVSLDLLDRKSTTMFTIAGHHFRKVQRFAKDDRCRYCARAMDSCLADGQKCADCKQLFHFKCIQNGGVVQVPCRANVQTTTQSGARRKHRKHLRSTTTAHPLATPLLARTNQQSSLGFPHSHHHAQFSLTGTSEFTDRTDKIISDVRELQKMQDFITKKICKIESEEGGKKPSQVDRVFKQALREFKDNLVATYSVVNKQDPEALNIKYKDLIANFLHVMETVVHEEQAKEKAEFPVTMGVNAFRGFLNEFMTLTRDSTTYNTSSSSHGVGSGGGGGGGGGGGREKKEKRSKKEKKRSKQAEREESGGIQHAGHVFTIPIINIPTACEICTSFFMWPIERGLVCQNCKLTCHKKCYLKSAVECCAGVRGVGVGQGEHHVFGVPLRQLLSKGDAVPLVVERLITTIEMYGLYTEGIYRKSGVSSKVRELKMRIEEGKIEDVQFEQYQVHVLTSVLKSFLREMPEPLVPFDSYDELLRAASLTADSDRIATTFALLNKLPKPNYDLLERLVFHLARVAQHEHVNRMNASALAIVFAPCILRTCKLVPAQDSLHDIGRQTRCLETIIVEQLSKVRATLADIDTLDTACHTATTRLSSLRTSKIFSAEELQAGLLGSVASSSQTATSSNSNSSSSSSSLQVAGGGGRSRAGGGGEEGTQEAEAEEEALLVGQLEEIQKEKALLTSALPSLVRASSDDDLLSTDDGSLDDVDTTTATATAPPTTTSQVQLVQSDHKNFRRSRDPPSDPSTNSNTLDYDEDHPIMV